MTAKHTPGPWTVGEEALFITPRSNFNVAFTREAWGDPDMTQRREIYEANARLIAAAPDTMVALERLYKHAIALWMGANPTLPLAEIENDEVIKGAYEAIVKAKHISATQLAAKTSDHDENAQ